MTKPTYTKTDIAAALTTVRKALAKISNLPATQYTARRAPAVFKLFELKLVANVLKNLSAHAVKWKCSTAPSVTLSDTPRELSDATTFSSLTPGFSVAIALNVKVHYQGSPGWLGARHEADHALFNSAQIAKPYLVSKHVYVVVEAKYRKVIPKSILRELAFVARQLGATGGPFPPLYPTALNDKYVILAIPEGTWRQTKIPKYWAQAGTHYRVNHLPVEFP